MAVENNKHRVFISYHRTRDQRYREALLNLNARHNIFIDASVDTSDIDENLDDETIRHKIRDEYLKNSSVTLALIGAETKKCKHVDWEICSSMTNGKVNRQSGVLVINLPCTGSTSCTAAHGDLEIKKLYPENTYWTSITKREEYELRYPCVPERIIDNLVRKEAKVSVTHWDKIMENAEILRFLIDITFNDRANCQYDSSRPLWRPDLL
jgi:hypothetical protein